MMDVRMAPLSVNMSEKQSDPWKAACLVEQLAMMMVALRDQQ